MIMVSKFSFTVCLFFLLVFTFCEYSFAEIAIHSRKAVDIELRGYNGLTKIPIFTGKIPAEGSRKIDSPYRGLALLIFKEGQSYPLIIGDNSFTLKIIYPAGPPAFSGSGENEFFYKLLSGADSGSGKYPFALLMIQAKELLESSHSIHTIKELTGKKREFHDFVASNYEELKNSDMVRRLLGQYFMMHEYIDYHLEGAPATDIRVQYQKSVLDGVKSWLRVLEPSIPKNEILNYCVSLYYNRSMVTLASLISESFKEAAFCPGESKISFNFPDDLHIINGKNRRDGRPGEVKGTRIIAFVSDKCPVSMVETIIRMRQYADLKKGTVIVAPLEKLSEKHLAMSRMVSGGKMFFISDEKWRKENLKKKVRLPLFRLIESAAE